MKYVNRIVSSLVLTGVYGAAVAFWYFVIIAIKESSTGVAVLLIAILALSTGVVFASLRGGADTDEAKTGR
ncbi:hypothetical protein PASE110613_09310 [Paenibacillus sediminis]|uniref:Uncharacterized protein n=1 Tax=Paenibacillus sediminis TaxID=664909 RepID=A0ABS4H6K0_9BACL|nr:hypothetical protein [Paenibacillus sediminis]MBP1938154.1 hypothetical protein [Paenibacillus sediminis]